MIRRSYTAVMAVCLFSGCTTPKQSPFQASWYFGYDTSTTNSQAQNQKLYIAILNQSKKPQTISNIELNQFEESKHGSGWVLNKPIQLKPGELLVKPATDFSRKESSNIDNQFPEHCLLPISVTVLTQEKESIPAEMVGRMPNLLPEGWEYKCDHNNHTSQEK